MGGVWARFNVWIYAGVGLVGVILGTAIGTVLGAFITLGHNHLLTRHTNYKVVPTVLWAMRSN